MTVYWAVLITNKPSLIIEGVKQLRHFSLLDLDLDNQLIKTLAVCEAFINARFDYVDAYTHTNTHKLKMTLPWFIRAIVATAGIFREIMVFLFQRTTLEKWVVRFRLGVVGNGLLRLWFIRFMHGTVRNGSLRLRVIRFMHRMLGSFAHWRK